MAATIILKDRNGKDVAYEGIETVTFDTPDEDVQATFTHGKVVDGIAIELDFSGGEDMEIFVPDGSLVKEATIVKPADLAPENVRKGKNIGGTDGEFIGDTEERTVDLNFISGSVETDLLPLDTYSGFALHSDFGVYGVNLAAPYTLTVGKTYMVQWDDFTGSCVAQDASAVMDGCVVLGNASAYSAFGLSGNNEPFVIGHFNAIGGAMFGDLTDTEAGGEHTFRIYQVTESVGDMVVTPTEDDKVISKVTVAKPEGAEQVIAKGQTLGGIPGDYVTPGTSKEVEPDFSAGDYTETAEGDERWSEVVVKIPENLLPENIANGVEIGGVVGTFEGGGNHYISYTMDEVGNVIAARLVGLTSVPHYAFFEKSALKSVDFSDSPGLTSIGNYAFYGCTALESFTIPDGVTEIGKQAFRGCTALTSVNIPYSVTVIGDYAFQGCGALKNITIPNRVTSIGTFAFNACTSVVSIVIPDSVTTLGTNAFKGCSALTSITIGNGITQITDGFTQDCISLVSIVIPDNVTSIGKWLCSGCTSIERATIGSGVASIGTRAFYSCPALESVTFKDTTTWYVGTTVGATTIQVNVSDASSAATLLNTTYAESHYWTKK